MWRGRGEEEAQDGLEDASLCFFVEVQAEEHDGIEEFASCGGEDDSGFPNLGCLLGVVGLEGGSEGGACFERGGVLCIGEDGFGEGGEGEIVHGVGLRVVPRG